MEDRILSEKYGLACGVEEDNSVFNESYINRLDCKPINMNCENNEPCNTRVELLVDCSLSTEISFTISDSGLFTFTASVQNAFLGVTYNWTFDNDDWIFVSQNENVLVLQGLDYGVQIDTIVSVNAIDGKGCNSTSQVGGEDGLSYTSGCTDPNALNYNLDATFSSANCQYEPLVISGGPVCNPDLTSNYSFAISGGVPPYTTVGTPNGAVLQNGSNYGTYIVDSRGTISNTISGITSCPFDCGSLTELTSGFEYVCLVDDNGFQTGQASFTTNPSGGTPPYSIFGLPTTVQVNDGDVIDLQVVDANGCQANESITINCEPTSIPIGIECQDIHFDFDFNLLLNPYLNTSPFQVPFDFYAEIRNLTPGVVIEDYDFSLTNNLDPTVTFNCSPLNSTPGGICNCTDCGGPTSFPNFSRLVSVYPTTDVEGEAYDFTIDVVIKIRTNSTICEYLFSQNFVGNLPIDYKDYANTILLQSVTQNF